MRELRVTVRVQNNRLLSRREGLAVSQKQLAQAIGVPLATYCELERCARKPVDRAGAWTNHAVTIAEYWDVAPETLFPDAILDIEKTVVSRELDTHSLRALVAGAVDDNERKQLVAKGSLTDDVKAVMSTLTEREQHVVGQHILEGKTLDEIAEGEGVSRERVRQIEAKALRKLRHPSRSRGLKKHVGLLGFGDKSDDVVEVPVADVRYELAGAPYQPVSWNLPDVAAYCWVLTLKCGHKIRACSPDFGTAICPECSYKFRYEYLYELVQRR